MAWGAAGHSLGGRGSTSVQAFVWALIHSFEASGKPCAGGVLLVARERQVSAGGVRARDFKLAGVLVVLRREFVCGLWEDRFGGCSALSPPSFPDGCNTRSRKSHKRRLVTSTSK